jgi:hypothetical protein
MGGYIDSSISFGVQNFFFVQKDTSDGTYDYYMFQNKKSTVLIMRTDKTFDNALYYSANGDFATIIAHRKGTGSYTYVTPAQLIIPSVS